MKRKQSKEILFLELKAFYTTALQVIIVIDINVC